MSDTNNGLPDTIFDSLIASNEECGPHGCEFLFVETNIEPYGDGTAKRDVWSCECMDATRCPRTKEILETALGMMK